MIPSLVSLLSQTVHPVHLQRGKPNLPLPPPLPCRVLAPSGPWPPLGGLPRDGVTPWWGSVGVPVAPPRTPRAACGRVCHRGPCPCRPPALPLPPTRTSLTSASFLRRRNSVSSPKALRQNSRGLDAAHDGGPSALPRSCFSSLGGPQAAPAPQGSWLAVHPPWLVSPDLGVCICLGHSFFSPESLFPRKLLTRHSGCSSGATSSRKPPLMPPLRRSALAVTLSPTAPPSSPLVAPKPGPEEVGSQPPAHTALSRCGRSREHVSERASARAQGLAMLPGGPAFPGGWEVTGKCRWDAGSKDRPCWSHTARGRVLGCPASSLVCDPVPA